MDRFSIAKIFVLQIGFNIVLLANVFYLYWRLRTGRTGRVPVRVARRQARREARRHRRADALAKKEAVRLARRERRASRRIKHAKRSGLLRLDLAGNGISPGRAARIDKPAPGIARPTKPRGSAPRSNDLDQLVAAAEKAESRTASSLRRGESRRSGRSGRSGQSAQSAQSAQSTQSTQSRRSGDSERSGPTRHRAAAEMTANIRRLRQGLDRAGVQGIPAVPAAKGKGIPDSSTVRTVRPGHSHGTARANRDGLSR